MTDKDKCIARLEAELLDRALMLDVHGIKPYMPHTDRLRALAAAMNCQVLPNGTSMQAEMIAAMIELDDAWGHCVSYGSDRNIGDLQDAITRVQDACQAMLDAANTDLENAGKPIELTA
jgi:hypothetical protein